MVDDTHNILSTFNRYAATFEALNPLTVLDFYHYPAILISPQKAVAIKNRIEAFLTFAIVMLELKRRGYHHAKTSSLSVRQLANNLAIVSGVVTRYKKDRVERDDTKLECFGLTYTLRRVDNDWKIVAGTLHDIIS